MRIDRKLLELGEQHYLDTNNDSNRGIRDPIITPFAMAMKIGGYVELPERPGSCSKLRSCPICPVGKSNYSTRYRKDGVVVWGCPHCQNITEE